MTTRNELNGSELTIFVEGRVDTQTAPDLQETIMASISGATKLALDFNEVLYISSAGLRTVLAAQQAMEKAGGSMVIRGARENIINVFKVTGFDNFLTLE